MRRYALILLLPFLLGAAPSRTATYTAGAVISPTDVTTNEDNIYSYLQGGVDTYKTGSVTTSSIADGTIANVDISSSAAISYSKLNLTNSITGADIAVGSDAQGDILYYNGTDWARLGAGTSGYFLKTQGAGANPTWAVSSLTSTNITLARTAGAGSGAVGYTGMGFQPTALIAYCFPTSGVQGSWAFGDDAAGAVAMVSAGVSVSFQDGSTKIANLSDGTNSMQAVLTSLDADGFTWTWTKTAAGIDTSCYVLGLR